MSQAENKLSPGSAEWYALADKVAKLLEEHGVLIEDLWHINAMLEHVTIESEGFKKARDEKDSAV